MQIGLWPSNLFAVAGFACVVACQGPPKADLRDWSAADHDHAEGAGRGARGRQVPAGDRSARPEPADLAWAQLCASCHGEHGRGDGPGGRTLGATDFTSEAWKARMNEAQARTTILQGKGAMPKFDLPEPVVSALIKKIGEFR